MSTDDRRDRAQAEDNERLRAELESMRLQLAALAEGERRYRQLFENMSEGFVLHEVITDERGEAHDFRVVEMNPASQRLTGVEPAWLVGRCLRELAPDSPWVERYAEVVRTGRPARFEGHSARTDRWYEAFVYLPAPGHCAVIFTDVTERRVMAQQLRQSEERFKRALENIPDVVVIYDAERRIQYINEATRAVTGRPTSDFIGKTEEEIWPAEVYRAYLPALEEAFRSGSVQTVETQLELPGDNRRWLKISCVPLLEERGRVREVLGITHDLTEHRRMERERRRIEAQLLQQQKLEAIGTLAAGVAHEINNPINGVINYAQLILDGDADGAVTGHAREILAETERVATIVRDLLAFSRQERQRRSPARIADIVGATVSLIRTIIRQDQIALSVDVPESLPRLSCRSQQLQQVLMNLLTNARDALNERFAGHDERKVLSVAARELSRDDGQWICIEVADQGSGIAPEIQDRIFEPFFTTKGRDRGTGLGLSIAHGIVADHGGRLTVDSAPGQGTRIGVELPARGAPAGC